MVGAEGEVADAVVVAGVVEPVAFVAPAFVVSDESFVVDAPE